MTRSETSHPGSIASDDAPDRAPRAAPAGG